MNKNEIILFWSTFNIKTDKDYINWIKKKWNKFIDWFTAGLDK